jgi:hypothetical protein
MDDPYAGLFERLQAGLLAPAAVTEPALRQAVLARAAALSGGPPAPPLPSPALATYIDTVARQAYRVTDAMMVALRAEGLSEVAIFELTIAAAVGAGLARRRLGLAPLQSGPATPAGDDRCA